ncbi:MAG: hypothetical protein A2W07_06410 [candidate division Zixibacteria bacterium RBG_16_43_9]|nr:MAG: hypothetical protein A2W07_06410 [candidate division Zixibacteria bacterium RBG_16_43_9]
MKKTVMFLALILLLLSPAFAKIYQVPSAFIATIQGGINVAKDGDTVLVMPGTYYENINFKGKNILLTSNFIFGQDTNAIHNTIIDGKDTASVVIFNSKEGPSSIILGFTVRHGWNSAGGGILCYDSSPRITYNIIKENVASSFFWPGASVGGGIFCYNSSAIIEYNNLIGNQAVSTDGEIFAAGGGVFCSGKGSPIIRYNLIAFNQARFDFGFMGLGTGGGIFNGESSIAYIYNNTIVGNYADESGGGIYIWNFLSGTKIFNNIIAFNSDGINARNNPGYTFRPALTYNDFWENENGNFVGFTSDVGDTTWGFNLNGTPCDSLYNIIRDPLFADTANFDFHLLANSPCIDAGDPKSPLDPDSTIADIGAFYYPHTPTFVKDDDHNTPKRFELSQNYPNPFNPVTTIPFTVYGSQFMVHSPIHTTLKVYNILGQLVRTLVDEEKTPGKYEINWDGNDDSGKDVGSGIYFYQLRTRDYTDTKKMVLLR